MVENTTPATTETTTTAPTIDDLKAPLLAAVGAADLALATVNEILATLRERAEEARTDATTRVDETRERLNKLQDELPKQFGELQEKLNGDELRKVAEGYADAATTTYNKLVERGEAALERLRSQPAIEATADRAEGYVDQAVELTQEALGNVASQTRAVGERAAKLVGVELPKKAEAAGDDVKDAVDKVPAKKSTTKKAPVAKKAPAKKAPAKVTAK